MDCKERLLATLKDKRCLLLIIFFGVKILLAICLLVMRIETETALGQNRDTVTTFRKEMELKVL